MQTTTDPRKLAQKAYPTLQPCEKCGSARRVQRHHDDLSKPLEVMFLCQSCHTERHHALGTWGMGIRSQWVGMSRTRSCTWCGKEFEYERPRQTTCSRSCGNKQAWSSRTNSAPATVLTDSEGSATPSSPIKR